MVSPVFATKFTTLSSTYFLVAAWRLELGAPANVRFPVSVPPDSGSTALSSAASLTTRTSSRGPVPEEIHRLSVVPSGP